MSAKKILWAAGLLAVTLVGGARQARACFDGRNMRYFFFHKWPEGVRNAIQVRIISLDGSRVKARLEKPFARALGVRTVVIDFPEIPEGGNCVDYGETRGSVFVPVSGMVRDGRKVRFLGVPTRGRPYPPPRSVSEIDRYIVDPAMKKAAEENRSPQ